MIDKLKNSQAWTELPEKVFQGIAAGQTLSGSFFWDKSSSGTDGSVELRPELLQYELIGCEALVAVTPGDYGTQEQTIGRLTSINDFSQEFSEFQSLVRNWNGQGSEAPSGIAMTLARNVLDVCNLIGLRPERLTPSAEGGVAICFRRDNHFASIECLNSGEIIALLSDGSGNPHAWEVEKQADHVLSALKAIREHIGF